MAHVFLSCSNLRPSITFLSSRQTQDCLVVSSRAIAIIHFNKKRNQRLTGDIPFIVRRCILYKRLYTTRNQEMVSFPFKVDTIAAPRHWTDVRFIWVSVTSSSSICQYGRITFTSAGFIASFFCFFVFYTHTHSSPLHRGSSGEIHPPRVFTVHKYK